MLSLFWVLQHCLFAGFYNTASLPGFTTLSVCCSASDKEVKSFATYKMYLVFFGFVVAMYEKVFKVRLDVCVSVLLSVNHSTAPAWRQR